MPQSISTRRQPFYGWVIVAACFCALTMAYGLQFSYGVFLPYLQSEMGLSRTSAAAPFSLYIATYSLLSFASGAMTDKHGPRPVVIVGALLLGLGYALLSQSSTILQVYLSLSLIAGIGMSATFIPLNATVVKWFVRQRGMALAFIGSGANAAAVIGPLFAAALIPVFGWRLTLAMMAAGGAVAIVLCGIALYRDPERLGLLPDGDTAAATIQSSATNNQPEHSLSLLEARKTWEFWIILGIFTLTWSILFFPYAHLPSLATDLGFDRPTAANLIAALGLGGFAGRMAIGALSDWWGRMPCLILALAVQTLACFIFATTIELIPLYLAASLFSAGSGSAITLFAAVIGDTFGRAHVGVIAGVIFAVASAASAFGPVMAGLIRDLLGTYTIAFLIGAGCNILALSFATRLLGGKPTKS